MPPARSATTSACSATFERQAAAERIQYLSSYDTLTGLPNRAFVRRPPRPGIAHRPPRERGTALILFDLDRFRVLNDTLGLPVGDQILVEVGRRLQLQVRKAIPSAG